PHSPPGSMFLPQLGADEGLLIYARLLVFGFRASPAVQGRRRESLMRVFSASPRSGFRLVHKPENELIRSCPSPPPSSAPPPHTARPPMSMGAGNGLTIACARAAVLRERRDRGNN